MQGKLVIYLGLLLVLCGGLRSYSQEHEYIYDHYNISNGLINDNVFRILVDREGHAWIVSYSGLQKFNGYEFETHTSNSGDIGSLSSNFVVDILEDRNGDLIVVLEDGIDIYDKRTNSFRNLVSNLPYVNARRNEINWRASSVQDKTGSIWVNCNNQLVRIDSTKEDFFVYQDELQGRFVINMDSTILWIITEKSIKRYHLDSKLLTITNISDIPCQTQIDHLNTIFYDSYNTCWLGTSQGLFIFEENNFRILDPSAGSSGINLFRGKLIHQDITAIYEDFHHDLWIASGSKLCKLERSTGHIQMLQHEIENPNSLLKEQITGIHGNQEGVLWVTYLNEGFSRINIRTNNFWSYRQRANHHSSLGGNTVRSVFKDKNGILWLGFYNNGLDRIEPASERIDHFKRVPSDLQSIRSNYISSLFVDSRERLWVGSHDNGLCYSDNIYGENLIFSTTGFLNGNDEIYHIQSDSMGRIWFGTQYGLGVFDYDSKEFQWVLKNHNIQSFIINNHNIWIASWNSGLCKLVFQEEHFISRIPEFDSINSFFYSSTDGTMINQGISQSNEGGLQNCISIYQDQSGQIWLGTYDKGLIKATVMEDGISYRRYDTSDGAPGNAVYGVSGDQQGNIWISTERGLGKFDPLTERFQNYYREDGLLSNYFMWKSYFKASDGSLYFGSVDGLNFFYPREILRDSISTIIHISEFRVHNQLVEIGDTVHRDVILTEHIAYQDTLILNHWNRNFSFRYYAAGHLSPQRLKYSYMMVGLDKEWIDNEAENRSAAYNNLSPGTYHFRIRTTDSGTIWNGQYEEKVVIILPPWWKTKLAIMGYLLLVLGLISLITHSLVSFLRLKQELLYNEKLHQSKLMFFTNISHEFKTPLSLIKAPINDILNEKELSPHNRKNLKIARHNADNLLNLVDELMEFRKTDTGNSKLRAEQIELTGFIKEVAAQFEYVAEQKGVHFYMNIPDETVQIWADRKKFRRIVTNLLENALKYTGEEGLVTLSIITAPSQFSFKPNYNILQLNQDNRLQENIGILVSDTGVGISADSLPKIFDRFYQIEAERASHHIGSGIGLALVKNLVLLHQGEIQVGSERGTGTEILVLFPLGDRHLSKEDKIPGMDESMLQESQITEFGPNIKSGNNTQVLNVKHGIPKVLLVEDHEELRSFLKEHLSLDYFVLEAANGREGLKILKEKRPDLIITDWIMPVMDGAALIKEIRMDMNLSTIPVILLTAKDELNDRQHGLEMGADQVITKPFNLQLLLSQVNRIIENNQSRVRRYTVASMENIEEVHEHRDAQYMTEVERIIKNNLRDPALNAEVIAREMSISRTALYDRIKSITGQTIGEYIQRIRLKHAIKLMLYEKISVSEVCVMVGFSSTSYMIRLFKKYYQTTPREYIRNYLKTTSN